MARKVYFVFGIHNHQPVGNFPEVFEMAYQRSYLPFLDVMGRHPTIKWSLHASGILWDFFVAQHPEYIERVRAMVAAGRVELLTGGYYEPIMSVIPDDDKRGQVRKLTRFLADTFDYAARGMWLAERVWEPGLVRPLADAGVAYTVVDDAHFTCSGLDADTLRGYYVTEDAGVPLNIFPISQRLRYTIPFQPVEKTIEYLSSIADEGGAPAVVMADDGEKFGLWPETYKHVYEDGWLDRFLTALEQNASWIETTTFSEYAARFPATGRVYLPAASYFEMSEWTLPSAAQETFESVIKQFEHEPRVSRFLRGGFWRNFLHKYPEANTMHKRMIDVSSRLRAARAAGIPDGRLASATDAVYAGQCNCAYWHGVFGGLYLPHLRTALYREIIGASAALDGVGKPPKGFRTLDIDCDGRAEVVYDSAAQSLFIAPHTGGMLYEWDLVSARTNLLNVLTRRPEAYHARLREFVAHPPQGDQGVKTIHDLVKVKEEHLDRYLNYDWHRRGSLIDHFLRPGTTRENFRQVAYGEQGDFVLGAYDVRLTAKKAILSRTGTVWYDDQAFPLRIEKSVTPGARGFSVRYVLENPGDAAVSVLFAPEFCFSFVAMDPADDTEILQRDEWVRSDPYAGLRVRAAWSEKADVWTFPLETVSLSEAGFERTYQGMVMAPLFRVTLPPRRSHAISMEITVS